MIEIKKIETPEEFHQLVLKLERISKTQDANITNKLEETKGKLDGRLVTFIKKILSLLPKVNLSTTNLNVVAKNIAQLAVDYEKKGYFTTVEQAKLNTVIENLRNRGKLHRQVFGQRMINEKIFFNAFKSINALKARDVPTPREPKANNFKTKNDYLKDALNSTLYKF